jgi:hypothetical protein
MARRKTFDELMEGVAGMKGALIGKVTLRSYKVEAKPLSQESKVASASPALSTFDL